VRVDDDRWVTLDLATFSQPLRPEISVDSLRSLDRAVSTSWDGLTVSGDCQRLTWTGQSTLWRKRYCLDVYPAHAEFYADVSGRGEVDGIRFFDAIPDGGFREHFALTKHFNDKGQTGARAYSTGSPIAFRQVFSPEPNSYARQALHPFEYGQVSVNADLDYNGGNFIANPGLLCFAVAAEPQQEWLAFGVAATAGEHSFSEYEYLGGTDFALNLNSWGVPAVDGSLRTPKIVMVVGRSPQLAFTRYVEVLRDSGLVPTPRREQPSWWSRPVVCGWGHQCYQADLFRVRSSPERPADNAAYTLSTQATYREIVERLDSHDLPWGTLVVDARWFLSGGLKDVDDGRWPDLRGFIAAQHRVGRRVLLWWSPWDPEGIPADQCVTYSPAQEAIRRNRPGRLSKFGVPVAGKKLAVDISLPQVRDRIREQVRLLLGPGPDGYGSDGFKIDHVSAAPGIYGMTFPEGSRRVFGIEAVREYLALLYETAKEVRPDALIVGQSPNPYLADVQDMLRLGDIYAHRSDSVVEEMTFRAEMARIADPSWLVDTDGWPMPSLAAMREYVRAQPDLGVPSLYYVSHLDTTGEALTAADFELIRRTWSRA
jgi:hypothetical protein